MERLVAVTEAIRRSAQPLCACSILANVHLANQIEITGELGQWRELDQRHYRFYILIS